MTDTLNQAAYKAACEARTRYRMEGPLGDYSIAGEDSAFIKAYDEEAGALAGRFDSAPSSHTLIEELAMGMVRDELERSKSVFPFEKAWEDEKEAWLANARFAIAFLQQREIPAVKREAYDGDWLNDTTHENGNYANKCIQCGEIFNGYKRRVICKYCDDRKPKREAQPPEIPDNDLTPLMTACASEFVVDAIGMGNLDSLAHSMLDTIRPYLLPAAREVRSERMGDYNLLLTAIYKDIEAETLNEGHPLPTIAIENAAQSIMGTIGPFLTRQKREIIEEKDGCSECNATGYGHYQTCEVCGGTGKCTPATVEEIDAAINSAHKMYNLPLNIRANFKNRGLHIVKQIEGGAS